MSGESQSTLGETAPGNRRTFSFKMDKPVAPYLIAMAIGDLRFQAISDTMGVWSEPAMVAKAAAEFADHGKFMQAPEELYGRSEERRVGNEGVSTSKYPLSPIK